MADQYLTYDKLQGCVNCRQKREYDVKFYCSKGRHDHFGSEESDQMCTDADIVVNNIPPDEWDND